MLGHLTTWGGDSVRANHLTRITAVWCMALVALVLGACGGGRSMAVPLSNVAYPYADLLRTLLPLRLASSLDGRVTAAAILYPANGKELAVFLHRKKSGQHHLTVFQARTCLYAEVMERQRADVDAMRDFSSIAVQVSTGAASGIRALLDSEFSGMSRVNTAPLPDMSRLEVGLLFEGGGEEDQFVRRESWTGSSSNSKLLDLCWHLWDIQGEGVRDAQHRVLAVLQEAGLR
jgi:hypothetical protein